MAENESIFSLRLVVADFYMEKPIAGLDPCYSEFRGKEIKRVPIIRIFGSNAQGQKTCMHVHGVFPYFYIPYDQKDFESLNKTIYQIAINLDKAINISLSQASSNSQHVFKIQLVKGIPFYGYHRSEHQFLKIYLFNPRFVRRAANLLQNGAILNKNFHPHESHVPYILQFMIDYNLYGMSFLHVPLEIVKFRRNDVSVAVAFKNLQESQILDCNIVKKVSCSSLEVDICSNFILNRFQLIAKTNTTHTNPGIESIWNDERLRRQKLAQSVDDNEENVKAIPPLEIPATQERPNVQSTESELFYRTALLSKLLAMDTSPLDSTQNTNQISNSTILSNNSTSTYHTTVNKQRKRTFNLTKLLQNSVYPEECTQNDNLINASVIQNHLSNNSLFEQSKLSSNEMQEVDKMEKTKVTEDESVFMDDTIIDEELVLSLTHNQNHTRHQQQQEEIVPMNATLREEDIKLLDVLQQLEENNEDNIDLDSSLAPLSQTHKNFALTPQELDRETTAAAMHQPTSDTDTENEQEDDDKIHDFSIALENLDDLILKLTQSQKLTQSPDSITSKLNVPQVDGADDLPKTPTKPVRNSLTKTLPRTPTTPKNARLTIGSPKRSPKTPKTGHKYAPLPLIPINRSTGSSFSNTTGSVPAAILDKDNLPMCSLRKTLPLSDMQRKNISVNCDTEDHKVVTEIKNCLKRRSKRLANLEKTHITCALTPRRTVKKLLKVYSVDNNKKTENENGSKTFETFTKLAVAKVNKKLDLKITSESVESNLGLDNGISPRKDEKQNLNIKTAARNAECYSITNGLASKNESDDEVIGSDNECNVSLNDLRKERLRRSLRGLNSSKRRKCVTTNTESLMNSSKTNENSRVNFANNIKLKECKVRLRKLKKAVAKNQIESVINSKSPPNQSNLLNDNLKAPDVLNANDDSEFSVAKNEIEQVINCKSPPNQSNLLNDNLNTPDVLINPMDDSEFSKNLKLLNQAIRLNFNCKETAQETKVRSSPEDIVFEYYDESFYVDVSETPPKPKEPHRKSIYKESLNLHSPSLFTESSSPVFIANKNVQNSKTPSRSNSVQTDIHISSSSATSNNSLETPESTVIITPLNLPPSPDEVLKGCHKLQLPEYEFEKPFYSNPDDITKCKELGFTVLQIPGNKLNDVEEFQSILSAELKGLTTWRRDQLLKLGGPEMLNKYRNAQRMREYFANQGMVIITPQVEAPTRQEVKLWLKAKEILKSKGGEAIEDMKSKNIDEDSPIKIRRQKVTMMLNAAEREADSGDDDLDCSSRSLTLTPLTPSRPVVKSQALNDKLLNQNLTPVTTHFDKVTLIRDNSLRKRNNCRVLRRISLNKQFKEAIEKESISLSQESATVKVSQESQKSESSVSSLTALAELKRSSFMRNLHHQHDVTINEAGFSENSTLNNTFGFKVALENLQQAKSDVEFNYLTIVTLEVFVSTRGDLFPNPEIDEIRCLFYAIENSIPNKHLDIDKKLPRKACGYIMVHDYRDVVVKEGPFHGIDEDIAVNIVQTEVEAIEALLGLCSRWDPDIYAGYEIEMSSWGFIIERAKYLCLNIAPLLSRVPTQKVREFVDEDRESFTDLDIEMKLCGRILLDVWRLLRSEIALTSYTFESVMYHIMHKRCPWHSYRSLTEWYASPSSRWIVIEYYLERVRGTLALLDQLDLMGRTSEMAKLIGIQFYEVLSRGSQFRVESMMLRIAKPKNLVPLSPSVQQRAHMRAPEYLPLIMEPQSRFYADPMIVLDFQSLYPSMMIAYNYCFSTCLGRVEHLGQNTPFEFGASQLRVSSTMLRKLVDKDLINISPCGVVFVKPSVREGILPRMLTEILNTRQMVKQSMKVHKSNSALQRILHSRQLGLKLMANVTYGYTAANFSGRMPAVEVGDSVVSKGRETLERAIKMVEANEKWNVRVVYGDTDSMFVLVPGRNREQAFRIGEEIAEAVTKQNPHPVKLKLEKVYQPCILQTKKRYVGYMYETPDQKEPVYEAKGIETVRRDGCPMVAKMLEKVLRTLFETADVSQVKHYVCRQFTKLLSGRANLQDLIFAKEFRGLNGYRPTACVPALEMTRKWIQTDPRRIPRRGERVPFIIINGPPGVPLIRLVRHPHEVLNDEGFKINAIYYITKAIIPPLNRCLLLIGADVNEWFANLPRKVLLMPALSVANEIISCNNTSAKSKKSTISQFFSTTNCIVDCGRQTKMGICSECSNNPTRSIVIIQSKISKLERGYLTTQNICQACCGRVGDLNCGSLDCPVLYVLEGKRRDLRQIMYFRNLLEEIF